MSKQTYLLRYLFIIERLERSAASFDELSSYLQMKSDITGDDLNISQRTLQRDIIDIFLQTGYEIKNDRQGARRYYIKERPGDSDKARRLLESYQLINIINTSEQYKGHVFLETRQARGIEHFHTLLYAISHKLPVRFNYLKYLDNSESERNVHPLALKEAIGRWYIVVIDTKDNEFKTFGLDRISLLETGKKPFRERYEYDITALFNNSFGVINDPSIKPQKVKLLFTYNAGKYVKAYPLHHSQKILFEDALKDEVLLELFIMPSYDFIKEILSHGSQVKVVAPLKLRNEIKKITTAMLSGL
ncbi:MAG: WYL domain-containing protein [Ferruginibacter sp.]